MAKPHQQPQGRPASRPSGRTNLASCVVASVFVGFIIVVGLIVYLAVLKPKDPKISVTSVQVPSFNLSGGSANFTFSQYVAVLNPNRASFSHYDSSLQLLYSGGQLGFLFIPAGEIASGRTQFMAATFAVRSFPLLARAQAQPIFGPTLEIESRIEMAGRVRVLHFFTHHVEATADCRVAIALTDGSVLGFHC